MQKGPVVGLMRTLPEKLFFFFCMTALKNSRRISCTWEVIDYACEDFECIFQAGRCRWPASSLSSAVGRVTGNTWRTCWTTSVTSESLCSCCCSQRAQTSLVRSKEGITPSTETIILPHFSCWQNLMTLHLSDAFVLTLLRKHNFKVIRRSQITSYTHDTVICARMLWSFNPSSGDTSVQISLGSQLSQSKSRVAVLREA